MKLTGSWTGDRDAKSKAQGLSPLGRAFENLTVFF